MAAAKRRMVLTMFTTGFGFHNDAWRHPRARTDDIGQMSMLRDMAQLAESARLDAIFFADSYDAGGLRRAGYRGVSVYEPITAMAALIGYTSKIGMIGTSSTTFNEPYPVARQFAALDVLSGGRIGWNIVTSNNGNRNFGLEEMPQPEWRYRRVMEFTDVVLKLWESWDHDAIVNDKAGGRWVDPDRLHNIDHVGEFFNVQGPLSIPRSPQERPVLVQAGQSPNGIELGSTYADLIYNVQPEKQGAIDFYTMYKGKVAAKGRDPEKVKLLPGVMPFVGRTQAEAEELAAELASAISEENGRAMVRNLLDVDVSDLALTDRIPEERFIDGPHRLERWRLFRSMAAERTLGELMTALSRSVGHQSLVGTPAKVAESMIDWFDARACDGFNFDPPMMMEGMENIMTLLLPELQERGYFPHEYVGDTFRERTGLTVTARKAGSREPVYIL